MAKLNNNELNAIMSEYVVNTHEVEFLSAPRREFDAVCEAIAKQVAYINDPYLLAGPVFRMSDIGNTEYVNQAWGAWAEEVEQEKLWAEEMVVHILRRFWESQPHQVVNALEKGSYLGGGLSHSVFFRIMGQVGCPYCLEAYCGCEVCPACPFLTQAKFHEPAEWWHLLGLDDREIEKLSF